jgi:hypothetical protein
MYLFAISLWAVMLSYSDAAYVCFESYLGFLLLYVLVIPAALYHFSSVFGIGVLITMEYLISLSALPALLFCRYSHGRPAFHLLLPPLFLPLFLPLFPLPFRRSCIPLR